jgi:Ca2+-binding RTX toxin-like protein
MPTANNDWVIGTAGDDTLDGGAGADTMVGGIGNDIYYVDNSGDIVGENAGEGKDTVYASVSHVLGANVENLVLSGTADWANGNNLDNAITGNAIANVLWGGEGNDTLTGGAGNDSYFVDSSGDVVAELADEGIDTLYSSISIPSEAPLTANVENLVLMGNAILGYGNALNNHITGNDNNNHLDGWGGIDTLEGGLGSDTYTVYTAGTVVIETANSGDYDTIYVAGPISYTLPDHVEQLALLMTGGALNGTGNGLNNTIVGNENANDLAGLAGDDILYGNDGNDILNAGVGNDTLDGGWVETP